MIKTYTSPSFGELKAMSINFDAVAPKEVIVTYNPKYDALNYYVQDDYPWGMGTPYFYCVSFEDNLITVNQKAGDVLKVIVNTSGSSTYDYGEYTIDSREMDMPEEVVDLVGDAKFYVPSYLKGE